jgi:type IV pilus assembly protein PilE
MAIDSAHRRPSSRRAQGFTLIELMIVVAIVAILATIANASYQHFVVKSRRAAAATSLQERAHYMERYYTTVLTYAGAPAPAQCGPDLNDFYVIAFNGTPGAKTFTLTATPTSSQNDSKCGTLSINAQGVRGETGSGTVADCW